MQKTKSTNATVMYRTKQSSVFGSTEWTDWVSIKDVKDDNMKQLLLACADTEAKEVSVGSFNLGMGNLVEFKAPGASAITAEVMKTVRGCVETNSCYGDQNWGVTLKTATGESFVLNRDDPSTVYDKNSKVVFRLQSEQEEQDSTGL